MLTLDKNEIQERILKLYESLEEVQNDRKLGPASLKKHITDGIEGQIEELEEMLESGEG